ncbi:MAG: hypothetical protein ETSY1_39025 [Candidatus Entotheonella factor]|uniref:MalT-like TPR region domain-containing protein n=2 Tax=Candidatus Entotheonella TaxID=93171 RepID=W4L5V8_ENTF1|nr:MAG: hypothetical protein ETSY1_39025 [Candidatus Entotheonella factor]
MAEQQNMTIYTGSCDETLSEPYQPFAELLSRLEGEEALGARQTALLNRLLRVSLPVHPVPALDEAIYDHSECHMAVSDALIRLAEGQPCLVMVDNLHAADQPSLELFTYLALTLAAQRTTSILLVASYRPVAPDSAVGQLLNRLQQDEDIVHRFELSGLDESETRELLQHLGVTRPTQQLIQEIHEATHGIPLFIQEAVHHAQRTGALYTRGGYLAVRPHAVATLELPPDIFDAIATRIAALPVDCQAVLTLASLLGDVISTERRAVLEKDNQLTMEAAFEAAIEQNVLRREADQYHFAHSLIRQAFAARLNVEQRQDLHLHLAQGLQQLDPDNVIEIAHHLIQAGPLADARTLARVAEQAGHQAFSRFAWDEAARYYEAALSVMDPGPNRATLHYQAGLSHYRHQDAGPALEHFEQARRAYQALGDHQGLAQSLMWLVRLHLMQAAVPIGVLAPYVDELEAILEMTETGLRGYMLTVLAQAYRHARQPEQGAALAQMALTTGRQLQDDRLCALAGESLGLAQLSSLQVESAIASWQESLGFAQSANDVMFQSLALANLPLALNLQGALQEGEAVALESSELTKTLQDWSLHSKALSHLASIALAKGDFAVAEQYARDTVEMVDRSHYPWGGFRSLGAFACASAARGLWDQANQALDTIMQPGRVFETPGHVVQVFVRVFRQLILGYQERRFTERFASLHDDLMEVVTQDTYSLAPLCAMIELGALCFTPSLTERPAEMLSVALERGVRFSSGWTFLIPRSLGVAAMMQKDWHRAEAHFQHAIAVASDVQALPELARTYLDYANWAYLNPLSRGDAALARELLQQAVLRLYERHMVPHARQASKYLEIRFPPSNGKTPPHVS